LPTDFPALTPITRCWCRFDIDQFIDFDEDYGFRGARQEKHADPLNTWSYDLASCGSIMRYDPVVPLSHNTKPILFAVGENDPIFTPATAKSVVDATAGPVELYVHPNGVHTHAADPTGPVTPGAMQHVAVCRPSVPSTTASANPCISPDPKGSCSN
jgi:hypothetical protein